MATLLLLIRGLPGSGKTTFARLLQQAGVVDEVLEADHFFRVDGVYQFDKTRLGAAHEWCQNATRTALRLGRRVAVANTFSQHWEMVPYRQMLWDGLVAPNGLFFLDLYDGGCTDDAVLAKRCVHEVPEFAITRMRGRWEK